MTKDEDVREIRREMERQENAQETSKWRKVNECACAGRPNALYKGRKPRLYILVHAS
jgi:ribosomal protein S14